MAKITAALVKELRDKTGAGMMDCKKALNENDADIEASVDWLRTQGLAAAAKKSGRAASEGLVGITTDGGKGCYRGDQLQRQTLWPVMKIFRGSWKM